MIRVGPHRFLAGTISSGAAKAVLEGAPASVLYSDPPWGPGNLKFWKTSAGKHGHDFEQQAWAAFLQAYCQLAAEVVAGPVYVEMGLRWVDELAAAMFAAGVVERRRWTIKYNHPPLPNALWLGWRGDHPDWDRVPADVEGMSGPSIVEVALKPWIQVFGTRAVVLDPCTGLGTTAKVASKLGFLFAGAEADPVRLERTIAAVERQERLTREEAA